MKNKDYRELQISSSALIFIFLAIIIVGIVIFLLGVSVGKRQAQISGTAQVRPEDAFEEVVAAKPQPAAEEGQDEITQEIAGHQDAQKTEPEVVKRQETKPPPPSPATKTKAQPTAKNLYYLQVGAFSDQAAAEATAGKYRTQGYVSVVVPPSANSTRQLYRVRIGGYSTRSEADRAKGRLVESEGAKAQEYFIVRQ
jgi:cell division protein FtsN